MLTESSRIARVPNLLSVVVDGETVMLDPKMHRYIGLDAIASAIWDRLETPVGVGDLCDELATIYDGDAETIKTEALAFLQQLADQDLIQRLN